MWAIRDDNTPVARLHAIPVGETKCGGAEHYAGYVVVAERQWRLLRTRGHYYVVGP